MAIGFNILNLAFRTDRKFVCAGNLASRGVPRKLVKFHQAIWGGDFSNSKEMWDAAADDGFPYLRGHWENKPGSFCYIWGTLRIIRYIASDEFPYPFGYYNQDDRFLAMEYPELLEICQRLEASMHSFRMLQLSPHTNIELEGKTVPSVAGLPNVSCNIHKDGDSGLIFTKRGAEYFLKTFRSCPFWIEGLTVFKDNSGCFSVIEPVVVGGFLEWIDNKLQDRIEINSEE